VAPTVRDKLKALCAEVSGKGSAPSALSLSRTSAQFDAQVRKEIETNSRIAKAANISVN